MIRDNQFIQAPFIAIPPALFQGGNGLNATAIAVWCALARWADKDTGKCWRPIRLLAKDIGQSERTVQRAIGTLKKAGWIKVTLHKGAHSEYRLIWGGSNAMSMQFTEESDATQASLDENTTLKTAQQREKGEKRRHIDRTSDATVAHDLYSLSILSEEERERPTNPFFSQKARQGDNQDKEQEQTDPCDGTSIAEVPPAIRRHMSIDELYQQEQERLMQQKKPGDAPAVEEGKHDGA